VFAVINIIGILIIILGFFSLSISDGELLPTYFFWPGFLLLLWPNKYTQKFSELVKWARIGIIIHLIGNSLGIFCYYFLFDTLLFQSYFGFVSFIFLNSLLNPASSMIDYFFPYPQIELPDGSGEFFISYFRTIITGFFNVFSYLFVGVVIGRLQKYNVLKAIKDTITSYQNK
jgi:hypothetical protein